MVAWAIDRRAPITTANCDRTPAVYGPPAIVHLWVKTYVWTPRRCPFAYQIVQAHGIFGVMCYQVSVEHTVGNWVRPNKMSLMRNALRTCLPCLPNSVLYRADLPRTRVPYWATMATQGVGHSHRV